MPSPPCHQLRIHRRMNDIMGIFDDIYRGDRWGFGSGHGSLPSVTKGYRAYLEMFIRENSVRSVVDYGCGDWQFSRLINWGDASYLGVDIVEKVIVDNQRLYANEKIAFQHIMPNGSDFAGADLLVVKDVLQHMSEKDIKLFLSKVVPKFKYCLITNCIEPRKDINASIATGEFRPLDLRLRPFNVPGVAIYGFKGPKTFSRSTRSFFPAWEKIVLLVEPRKS